MRAGRYRARPANGTGGPGCRPAALLLPQQLQPPGHGLLHVCRTVDELGAARHDPGRLGADLSRSLAQLGTAPHQPVGKLPVVHFRLPSRTRTRYPRRSCGARSPRCAASGWPSTCGWARTRWSPSRHRSSASTTRRSPRSACSSPSRQPSPDGWAMRCAPPRRGSPASSARRAPWGACSTKATVTSEKQAPPRGCARPQACSHDQTPDRGRKPKSFGYPGASSPTGMSRTCPP